MGQKVNPNGLRFGIYKKWNSFWYSDKKNYANLLLNDKLIRNYLYKQYKKKLQITNIQIVRQSDNVIIFIHTPKKGLILGKDSKILKHIIKGINKNFNPKKNKRFEIRIVENRNFNTDAQWIANDIANKLENRANYKFVQKTAINNAKRYGAKGIKTKISGRLNGVDIARSEGIFKR